MNIIILTENKKLADLISANLCMINETGYDLNIIHVTDHSSLKGRLQLFEDIELIIYFKKSDKEFLDTLKYSKLNPTSSGQNPLKISQYIYETIFSSKEIKIPNNTKFNKVNVNLFYYLSTVPCDIYLAIKKENKEEFVKRFNKDAGIEQSDIKIYEQKGLKSFHITAEDKKLFYQILNERLGDVIPIEKSFSRMEDVQEFILDQIKDSGISPILLKMANDSTSENIKQISSKKSLLQMLSGIMKSFNDYRYQHSYMTLIFCNLILKKMSWATPTHFEDFTTASFFHDISLDTEEEIQIHSIEDFNNSLSMAQEGVKIEQHANNSYEILKKNKDVQDGALRIIREHHGDVSGIKLTTKTSPNISKLSKIFILSEYITNQIIVKKETSLNTIILSFAKHYDEVFFKNEVEALRKAM